MGKAAASAYISSNKPLNDSIIKVAEMYGLNQEQVARVVETANVETYTQLNKIAEDKYIEFPTASLPKVVERLNFKKEAAALKFEPDPEISTPTVDYSYEVLTDKSEFEKKAEKSYFEKNALKVFKTFKQSFSETLEDINTDFEEEEKNLYNYVKQASLESGDFYTVKQAMLLANNGPVTKLAIDVYEDKLKKEASHQINFNEKELPKGVLNKNHPIVASLDKLASLAKDYEEMSKLANTVPTGAHLGRMVGNVEEIVGSSKDILNSGFQLIKRYPKTAATIAGLSTLAAYVSAEAEKSKANMLYDNTEYLNAMKLTPR
jgi:hypothetical protein